MRIIYLLLLLAITCSSYAQNLPPKAVKGKLDLSGTDLGLSGPVKLDGEWEIRLFKLLTPQSYSNKSSVPFYFIMPGAWNGRTAGETEIPDYGYATFILDIAIRDTNRMLGIEMQAIPTAYQLWAGDELLLSVGKVSTNQETAIPYWKPMSAYFTAKSTNIRLILQIANFEHNRSGMEYSALIGTASQIAAERENGVASDMFLFGILLIMGLYHIGLFSLRRADKSPLYFGLFCLVVAVRTLLTNEKIIYTTFPSIEWIWNVRIEYLTMPLAAILFLLFISALYRKETVKALNITFIVPGIIYSLIVLVATEKFFSAWLTTYHLILLVSGVYDLVILILALMRKREGALLILLGFLVLLVATVNDMMYVNQMITTGFLLSYGVFIFIFSQSFILSMRFSRAFHKEELLAKELERSNIVLEQRVLERTSELADERNQLQIRNERMENELELARKIQLALIPLQSPGPDIACYYKPMEKVGGDFYDFVNFPDNDMVGIFISDVSGHGVPAAFITSMMKSLVLQIAPEIDNPAEFLQYLNSSLLERTDGNFITAFYGIFNRRTRIFIYANAGHNPPYLISGKKTELLKMEKSGIPLAVLDNDRLKIIGKSYTNQKVELAAGSKLLLYTDGLVETVNETDKGINPFTPDFETEIIRDAIDDLRGLECGAFVERMSERLRDFRGTEEFDDDVCMICVDVG
ncbi:MAG: SpoIIE family protein phosphatase [Brevinematales bacterium]|nr:SpoIIE family protein phosphatase [Brevinematales bacterium]